MTLKIVEIKDLRQLDAFIKFPFSLYKDNPYWVPPLIMDEKNTLSWKKNPAYKDSDARFWLVYKNGVVAGRIAAIHSKKYIEKWGNRYIRFGWVDFIDDFEVSAALFKCVQDWAEALGMEAIHGPLGFTDMDPEGMLIEGFDELSTLPLIYNYAYYPTHLEKLGYIKDADWLEFEIQVPEQPNEKISKAAEIALKRNNLHLAQINRKKELLHYAMELFELLDEEYSHLYGTVPMSREQMQVYIDQYFGFVSPEFIPVVLDENNRMVAFGIVIPSIVKALQKSKGRLLPFGWIGLLRSLKKNDLAELYLIAVKSEYQGKGVNAVLMDHITKVLIEKGIKRVETNAELETNVDVQGLWKFYEKRQHKRRRCYIKHF